MSSELEKEGIEFEAALSGLHNGSAKYVDLEKVKEEGLQMVNIVVIVKKGVDKIPEKTTSFDVIKWSEVGDFLQMWECKKDISILGIGGDKAFGICVDGLCILSTYDILKAKT